MQTAIRALVFTPTAHQVAPGSTVTTTFTILVTDANLSPSASTTTVVATAVTTNTATTNAGTTTTTKINDKQTATPFSGVTFTDPDAGEAYSLKVTLSAAANGI